MKIPASLPVAFEDRTDTEDASLDCFISGQRQVRGLFSAPLIEILLLHQNCVTRMSLGAESNKKQDQSKPMSHDPRYTPSEPNVRLPRRSWVLLLHFSQGDRRVRTRRQIELEENVVRAQSGAGGD